MSDDMLRHILDRITAGFQPERVILFGSHARGQADDGSDVDLLVVADTARPPTEEALAIRRRLGDLPVAFDILVKSSREYQRFRNVVNHIVYFADRNGKVVYER